MLVPCAHTQKCFCGRWLARSFSIAVMYNSCVSSSRQLACADPGSCVPDAAICISRAQSRRARFSARASSASTAASASFQLIGSLLTWKCLRHQQRPLPLQRRSHHVIQITDFAAKRLGAPAAGTAGEAHGLLTGHAQVARVPSCLLIQATLCQTPVVRYLFLSERPSDGSLPRFWQPGDVRLR